MTTEPIPIISNPELTTTFRYGGDVMLNIRSLLTDVDLSPVFDGWRPKFRTQVLFRSGKIAMLDEDSSNEVHLYVDDIINHDGNVNLHIPAFTDDDDTILLQNHPQQINYKVLGTNITVADDIDFNTNAIIDATISGANNNINNISDSSLLQITDKGKLPTPTVYTDQPNTYNTSQMQTFRSGQIRIYDSDNTNLITLALGNQTVNVTANFPVLANSDTLVFKGIDNNFSEWQTIVKNAADLLHLYRPSSGAVEVGIWFDFWNAAGTKKTYSVIKSGITDNTTGSEDGYLAFQTILNGTLVTRMLLNNNGNVYLGTSPARAVLNVQNITTVDKTFTFPDVIGNIVVDAHANVFINRQKIQWNGSNDQLKLFRGSAAAASSYAGMYFSALNNASAEISYADIIGGSGPNAADIVAGTEKGQMAFQLLDGGSLTTKIQLRSTTLETFGVVPKFQVGSGDFNAMTLYRPVNSTGSNNIIFDLQNSSSIQKTFGQIGVRSMVATTGSEAGALQVYLMKAGATASLALQVYNDILTLGDTNQLSLDKTGLTGNRTFTFPNLAGQLLTNNGVQTVTDKTVSSGWTITGDLDVNNSLGLHITKNAGSGVAEILSRFQMADNASSYFQIDNATATDGQFVPRITTYNSSSGSIAPGLYVYSNILAANDNTTTNGVIVLDSRRVENAALTTRPILEVRNFTTNVFRIIPTQVQSLLPHLIHVTSGSTDFETMLTFSVSDAPSCSSIISNGTSTNTVFTPIWTSSALAAAASSAHIAFQFRNTILAANDSGSVPLMVIEGRQSDATVIDNRPILGIRNLNTDQFLFYPDYIDIKNHFIQVTERSAPPTAPAGTIRLWADSTTGKWSQIDDAGVVTTFGAGGGGGASAMDDLTDADTTTTPPALNDVLTWDGTNWIPAVPPGASGGEANTISNVGTGVELAKPKVGVDIPLRTLLGNINFALSENTDDITFAIKNVGAFKYSIFKDGSTYYLRNNVTGAIEVSNAAPDTVFQTALTNGGDIYVYDGDYTFTAASSPVLSMPVSPVYARLFQGPNVNLIVPQGFTGVLLQFRHAAVGTAGVTRCKISGGNMKEAGTRQELWTAIQFYGDAGVSVTGIYWNVVEDLQIYYPKKGIHLLNASGGTLCFMNQNIFRNIIIWYPIEDGVHFDMQNAYVASTNGFHRNRFEYVSIQGAGETVGAGATVGFRDIRHKDNSFIGCYPVDFTGDAKTATIHADAVSTEIFGGTMDAIGYVNSSSTTKAITENGRITTNGINPANGNNLDTLMGAGQTTLTWSFWNTALSERFYIQKNTNEYQFDFVRQTSGGALRPVLFRQYDVTLGAPGLVESFRIETDSGLRVNSSKLRLRDSNDSHNYTFVVSDISANRNITIPALTANDTMAMTDFTQTLLNKTLTTPTINGATLSGTFTLPAAVTTGITFTKTGGSGSEKFFTFNVSDDAGTTVTFENVTTSDGLFAPAWLFTQHTSNNASAGAIIGRIASTHDIVNEVPVIDLNARINNPSNAVIANRPLVSITNLTTKEYVFYATYADFKTNEIRNAAIDGTENTLTNIPDSAITDLAYAKLTGVPTEFAPEAHTHTVTDISPTGTALQVVRTNSAGNGVEWASLDSEKVGVAVGDGGSTQYIIPHGMGAEPTYVFIDCPTHSTGRTWTKDGTNITVNFDAALSGGTDAVEIMWKAIA